MEHVNNYINIVCGPFVFASTVLNLFHSTVWMIILIRDLIKRRLTYVKSCSSLNQYQDTIRRNYNSGKIVTRMMLVICVFEFAAAMTIVLYGKANLYLYQPNGNYTIHESLVDYFEIRYKFSTGASFFYSIDHIVLRLMNVAMTLSVFSLFSLVRILTQYLISLYSFYKCTFKLDKKIRVVILWNLVILVLGIFRPLIILQYVAVIIGVITEYVLILMETRNLSKLLIQRYTDAKVHEYQHKGIIQYYKSACEQYKFYSFILLCAFCLQLIGFIIYCIHPIVMIIVSFPNTWVDKLIFGIGTEMKIDLQSHPVERVYNLVICSIEEVSLALGLILKVTPSFLVLIFKFIRYVKNQCCVEVYQPHISMKNSIDRNNEAYMYKKF